jgi:hypothetical protein
LLAAVLFVQGLDGPVNVDEPLFSVTNSTTAELAGALIVTVGALDPPVASFETKEAAEGT